jgi:hypothetical protein
LDVYEFRFTRNAIFHEIRLRRTRSEFEIVILVHIWQTFFTEVETYILKADNTIYTYKKLVSLFTVILDIKINF